QKLDFDRNMPITVRELLSLHTKHKNVKHAQEALQILDAKNLFNKRIGNLSGGEFQRVLLAMALQNRPEILFLDEPTASIDAEGAGEIYDFLQDVRKADSMTIVLVSHDIDVVYRYTDTVICMNKKIVCKGKPNEAITDKTIQELYGKHHTVFTHK
ncbi:MAG: ATP-binding cassette domain-containing protein, partial [Parcubacteria group bacterium]